MGENLVAIWSKNCPFRSLTSLLAVFLDFKVTLTPDLHFFFDTVLRSQATISIDLINYFCADQQIAALLQRDFLLSFFDFIGEVSKACNYSENLAKLPVRVSIFLIYL